MFLFKKIIFYIFFYNCLIFKAKNLVYKNILTVDVVMLKYPRGWPYGRVLNYVWRYKMKKFLLSTAAVAMAFCVSSAANAGEKEGKLDIYIEFSSSVEFSQSAALNFGKVDLSNISSGQDIGILPGGGKDGVETLGSTVGEMLLTDSTKTAVEGLQNIQVGDTVLDSDDGLTGLGSPIVLTQGEGGDAAVCGYVSEMGALWDPSVTKEDGRTLPISIGGRFIYEPGENVVIKNGSCSGSAVLTAIYE